MPQLDKLLLAHALTMGLDYVDQIEVTFRQGQRRYCCVFDGVKLVPTPDAAELSPMAVKILRVIERLDDGDSLIGKEVAAECGYTFSGNFRKCIAELVGSGKIQKFPSGGYGRLPS